jgi:hypothetical protein
MKRFLIGSSLCFVLSACSSAPVERSYAYGSDYDFSYRPAQASPHDHLGYIEKVEELNGQEVLTIRLYGGGVFTYVSSSDVCHIVGQEVALRGKNGTRDVVILPK